jgi:hypothetical protein
LIEFRKNVGEENY